MAFIIIVKKGNLGCGDSVFKAGNTLSVVETAVVWNCLFLYYCLYLIALAALFLFIPALTWSGMCQEAFRQLLLFIAEQNPHTHLHSFT